VLEVDLERNRISLSMKSPANNSATGAKKPGLKKTQTRAPKPKKKQQQKKEKVKSNNTSFNNPLAEALIKSGFKH